MSQNKALLLTVRRVLWESWDPIGVNEHIEASNEYDSYASTLVGMLSRGCSARDIERHLDRLETESMGLPSRPPECRAAVVAELMRLR